MKKLLISVVVALFAIQGTAIAQVARIYDSERSLPNAQINDLYQDSAGFMWLCSHDGLARFDGTGFIDFRCDPENENSLANDLVLTIYEDSQKTHWVGTAQGLQIYNPDVSDFSLFHLYSPEPHVSDIVEFKNVTNGKNRLFIGTSGRGVIVVDPYTHAQDITLMENISQNLFSVYVNYLFIDSKGRLWISSELGGLSVVSANTCNVLSNVKWDASVAEKQKSVVATSMAEDPVTHNIVICTINDGIFVFDAQSQTIRRAKGAMAQKAKANSVLYNDLFPKDDYTSFIIGLENNGMVLYNVSEEELETLEFPNTPYDFSTWKIHCLSKDSQGNLWAGAFQRGVLVVPRQIYGFSSTPLSARGIIGENSGCITSIYCDEPHDAVWAGCDGGGLFYLTSHGRYVFNKDNSGLDNNSIMCLTMDKRGTLWIGTYLGGIFCKKPNGPITKFRENAKLPTERVSSLVYDKKRDAIYAGFFSGGLTTINAATETIENITNDERIRWTGSLTLDSRDRLWICSTEGLTKYDISLHELTEVKTSNTSLDDVVLCCYADQDVLWLGTRKGLVKFDTTNGNTRSFTKNDGLPSNSVYAVQKDVMGRFWISTADGLSCFDPFTEAFKNYYAYDGIQGNEFRQASTFQSSIGEIYFGGNSGITKIRPFEFEQPSELPPVNFAKLTVMNKDVYYDPALGRKNIIDKNIEQATRIVLPHRKNVFGIGFSISEYTNPAKIHYRYKMERFDQDWAETTQARRHVNYTNLSPGKYTFRVRAFYEDTPEMFSERSINIKIKAPWYLSFWAILVYAIILSIITYFIVRMKKAKKKEDIQNMRLNMFTNLTHEIRTPLTLVMSPLKTMRENEQNGKLKDTYNLMYRNCLRINRIVNQFMDVRKIDEGKMKLNFRETEIIDFIRDILQSFSTLGQQKNISMNLETENPQENIWVDQGNFDKIIFNLLSNAFKNTPEDGSITVNVSGPVRNNGILSSSIADYIRIDVHNTGSHIDEKDLVKIFNRFYQTSISDASIGSGVGLNLTKMLTDLHHGRIQAENTEDGVMFSLFMPCDKKHLNKEELNTTTHHKDLYTTAEHPEQIAVQEHDEGKVHLVKSRKTVIFVDDDSDMLIYVQQHLKQTFNVLTFDKAPEAWDVIKTLKPDAVVTDLDMPQMRGTELCHNIKTNPDTALVPVIILTAQTDEDSMQEATDVEADRVLLKPISVELLSSSILKTISNRERITARQDNNVIYEYGSIKMNSASDKLVARVMDTIKQNIDNSEFSVETLCQEVGISRVHLNRRLKELVGTSPSQLIRSIRLRQAAFLLINNQVGIAEVAFKVGYSSLSHFSNSFHEYYNMSPKEFVAKYQGVTDEEVLKDILK